jgi:hypothetical protein
MGVGIWTANLLWWEGWSVSLILREVPVEGQRPKAVNLKLTGLSF